MSKHTLSKENIPCEFIFFTIRLLISNIHISQELIDLQFFIYNFNALFNLKLDFSARLGCRLGLFVGSHSDFKSLVF